MIPYIEVDLHRFFLRKGEGESVSHRLLAHRVRAFYISCHSSFLVLADSERVESSLKLAKWHEKMPVVFPIEGTLLNALSQELIFHSLRPMRKSLSTPHHISRWSRGSSCGPTQCHRKGCRCPGQNTHGFDSGHAWKLMSRLPLCSHWSGRSREQPWSRSPWNQISHTGETWIRWGLGMIQIENLLLCSDSSRALWPRPSPWRSPRDRHPRLAGWTERSKCRCRLYSFNPSVIQWGVDVYYESETLSNIINVYLPFVRLIVVVSIVSGAIWAIVIRVIIFILVFIITIVLIPIPIVLSCVITIVCVILSSLIWAIILIPIISIVCILFISSWFYIASYHGVAICERPGTVGYWDDFISQQSNSPFSIDLLVPCCINFNFIVTRF